MPKGRPPHKSTTEALNAYNRARSADWDSVDWRLSNQEIARQLGRALNTVEKRRVAEGESGVGARITRCDKGSRKPQCRPPNIEETQKLATQAAQKSPLAGKCETNIHAKDWVLVSPDGIAYRIRNLYEFVRQNPHLFRTADVVWKRTGGKRGTGGEYCNATTGILNIKGGRAKTWKGWKLVIE